MQIRAFVEDDEHNIWFGTFVGLQKYDVRKQTYTLIQIPQYVGGLNHPSIFSLYTDRQGTIWIGSFYGGVTAVDLYIMTTRPEIFPTYIIHTLVR